jgi:antitoxin VapB
MAFHVRDPRTDALVRELARKRGIGITEAIREAVEQALRGDAAAGEEMPLMERLQPLFDRMDRMARTGSAADKKFFDEMWGQGDE